MKRKLVYIIVVCAIKYFVVEAKADSTARDVLETSIAVISNAQSLYYEGARVSPRGPMQQKYYLRCVDGTNYIRAESSITMGKMKFATTFLKDQSGVWEIDPDQAIEVSKAFTTGQLLGVYPFHRFFMCLQYPYELSMSEDMIDNIDYFIIKGELPSPQGTNEPDLAKEFTYTIAKTNGMLQNLHEVTFARQSLDIKFIKLEINPALDSNIFELPPGLKKTVASSFSAFMTLRGSEVKQMAKSPTFQAQLRANRHKSSTVLIVILILMTLPLAFVMYSYQNSKK